MSISDKEFRKLPKGQEELTPEEFLDATAGLGLTGKITDEARAESTIIGLVKMAARSKASLETASAALVAVNVQLAHPVPAEKFKIDFLEHWKTVRNDSTEDIDEQLQVSIMSAKELYKQNMPLPEVVIEGLMYQGELGMLAGWQGRGKSFFAMGLALSLISGQSEFCGYKLKKSGAVIYIDYEQSLRQLNARLKKHPLGSYLENAKYDLRLVTDAPEISEKKFMARLVKEIDVLKPILVIVDNVTMAHSGDENSSRDVIRLMKNMKTLVKDRDVNVLLLHHFRKGVRFETLSLEHVSGSGAWSRLLNFALLMAQSAKDENLRIFKADKLRDWSEIHKAAFSAELTEGGNFIYSGLVENETEHLPQATATTSGANWKSFMKEGVEMKREQIITELRARGVTATTVTIARWLDKAKKNGDLVSTRDGFYVMPASIQDAKAKLAKIVKENDITNNQ